MATAPIWVPHWVRHHAAIFWLPEPRSVRGTNMVEIASVRDAETGRVVLVSAIDNLGKGASGAAVQNLNLMLGMNPATSL